MPRALPCCRPPLPAVARVLRPEAARCPSAAAQGFEGTGQAEVYDDRIFAFAALVSSVLVYNFLMKLNVVDPCETNRYAKHFYCFNKSDSPGVHVDNDVRL